MENLRDAIAVLRNRAAPTAPTPEDTLADNLAAIWKAIDSIADAIEAPSASTDAAAPQSLG